MIYSCCKLNDKLNNLELLTMYNEHNSLADRWRHTIGRNAKVCSHLQPVYFSDIEDRSINAGHYNR